MERGHGLLTVGGISPPGLRMSPVAIVRGIWRWVGMVCGTTKVTSTDRVMFVASGDHGFPVRTEIKFIPL